MVPRRVIEDSDGDDVSFMLSDPLSPPVITNESDAVPMIQPTSTGKLKPYPRDLIIQAKHWHNRPNAVSFCI
jgi:hypothetical protein